MQAKLYPYKLLLALLLSGFGISAQAQFTLEGQYRPRTEIRNGFKSPILEGQQPAIFTEHRARITAGYGMDKIGFKMSVQDVRIWGETGQINKTDNLLSIHEAYGEYKPNAQFTLRVGRQEIALDGHRFFGTLDWAAQARAFDAVQLMYQDSLGRQFRIMGSFNQNGWTGQSAPEPAKNVGNQYYGGAYQGANPYTTFGLGLPKAQLLAYGKQVWDKGSISVMGLADFIQPETGDTYPYFHLGITPEYKLGAVKVLSQIYYSAAKQTLSDTNAELEDMTYSGYFLHLSLQHTQLKGKPLIGVDYISGDDKSTANTIEGWAPLYGTNHKFYGFMDYFYVGSGHNGGGNQMSGGLIDTYLKTTFSINKSTKLLAHLHAFMSPTTVNDPTGTTESLAPYLGTEVDLVLVKKLAPSLTLKAGYSQMFATTSMQQVKGQFDSTTNTYKQAKGFQNWSWVMLNFTPKFLN
ncbi:alginate export family protein [Algivirga pacifica]|uniref:Alginate export family protein n=1 Tax=Algivirga pacifica TaxID=1162670 RepID=A0ABP9D8K2_9BACT